MEAMKKALQKKRAEKGAEIKIMIGLEDEGTENGDDSDLAPESADGKSPKMILEELMGSTSKPVGRHSMSLDEHARDMMEKKMLDMKEKESKKGKA